ncbi:MAG: Asp-tRNA(Asn)/Glu-tRNA(Gln) amidotransferase subunit GatA [Proteobacteria bacterium]|jgi:aspartyl-tRNA(Asn)/glutamyl-tRNA(Gln) amidotransferase subunit A|nr:Asp-tRNA(Asn)/Glu-tRNA(Gln) amidotransferase subunit GatA [Pseudomonadota bacterium]NCW10412.1 Asp-tRNA(Asn)/Glu-tRNA(Gln) amidotransferase subunit GatA [Pseudomonadota bacterium]NCW37551.1 Asp-tRNA(Asn)/Glu-tRNA(Gln) amidotransferase subunit GatA [Pseudomonadota bacterium]NCX41732.1 Asp-tRNA(Asn)/Glu-tRNA(Gln) amidotransferase subunit GatA [Pseudomonadota bacterium]NDH59228.1 Asp-tRNA(Asn)/Glu-tRNA(Gln) amidotransferase subunit GatA [Pseudomonadota bacterium]
MSVQYKSIKELKNMLNNRDISHTELIQETFLNIKNNSKLNAFITLNEEESLKKANNLDNIAGSGSLAGIPIAQKDLFCTKDLKTTCGSNMLSNFIPPYSATVIKNLENAGCISVGKTNMDEFAMGSSNETSFYGNVQNPWGENLVPGGSSGGSAAAVAAGIVPAASGTDTGGSIRQPASLCGISGLKPTYGRISRWGMIAFASSLDQAGPMARTAEDCALLLNEMCSHDEKDTTSIDEAIPDFTENLNSSIQGLKIGLVKEFDLSKLDNDVVQIFEESKKHYESLGAEFIEISLPNISLSVPTYYVVAPAECSSNLSRFDGVKFGKRCDNPKDLEELYIKTRSEGFGDEVKRRILIGSYVLSAGFYDAYYKKAQQVRRLIKNDFDSAFKNVDIIMSPTTRGAAFEAGSKGDDPIQMYLEDLFTIPANLAGLPAMSIPNGMVDNKPIGLQLIGNFLDESRLLQAAHNFQISTDWHLKTPSGSKS